MWGRGAHSGLFLSNLIVHPEIRNPGCELFWLELRRPWSPLRGNPYGSQYELVNRSVNQPTSAPLSNNTSVRFVLSRSVVWLAWGFTGFRYNKKEIASHLSITLFKNFAISLQVSQREINRAKHLSTMHFSSALLVLASVFIVGSGALNMFVFHLFPPSSEITACITLLSLTFSLYKELTVADLVKQYPSLQAATEDLTALLPRPPLLQSAQPAAATRAWPHFSTRAITMLSVNATWVNPYIWWERAKERMNADWDTVSVKIWGGKKVSSGERMRCWWYFWGLQWLDRGKSSAKTARQLGGSIHSIKYSSTLLLVTLVLTYPTKGRETECQFSKQAQWERGSLDRRERPLRTRSSKCGVIIRNWDECHLPFPLESPRNSNPSKPGVLSRGTLSSEM